MTPGARLQYGRSDKVLGSQSPATAEFFYYTCSRSPWRTRNIPDGPIHTIGTICTLNFRSKWCPTSRNSECEYPNSDQHPIWQCWQVAVMPPITSIIRHPAIAAICPSVRWWAVALLDVWTFVGNSLYIIYETSHYRCFCGESPSMWWGFKGDGPATLSFGTCGNTPLLWHHIFKLCRL